MTETVYRATEYRFDLRSDGTPEVVVTARHEDHAIEARVPRMDPGLAFAITNSAHGISVTLPGLHFWEGQSDSRHYADAIHRV
jgi:hypothetical protein